ncbi:MAG: 4-hydroxybutyrate CoA-transferase [Mesorhizobium sp.]|nr:acetyl-CoA hydrolase/transferase C-terminal domain-containing protein [Mesorhizobium sp.]MCO5161315.1 4-hydroxybutyrate CoA-transferase [Mesorhizobium sp.]
MPVTISPADVASYLPQGALCWISACSAESAVFREGLSGLSRPDLTFTSIFVPGLNRPGYLLDTGARITTFFMLPEFAGSDRVDFLPLSYRDIRAWLAANPPQAALVMVSPPGADGRCSFGPVTDFIADLWERVPLLIGHVNPLLPPTFGTPGIPLERFTAVIEMAQALPESDPGCDDVSVRAAAHVAAFVSDGATIQAGLGRAPEAVLRGLTAKRGLAIHSGLIGDSTLHLLRSGSLRADDPITAGVAIGTRALYDAVSDPRFAFRPPSHTHDVATLAQIERLVAINSAIEVDLDGQAHSEMTPTGFMSGPGGASDFAAGARGKDGLRIVVLPSTAAKGAVSRIVPTREATGPVSLGRFDIDVVVTEHGAADLRGKSHKARRAALIAIADPAHRDRLAAAD